VMVLGLLMLVSLIVSAILAAFGEYLTSLLPQLSHPMIQLLNFLISFFFIVTLFAMIFKLLPDVKLRWKTVYQGAILTTVFFLLGEFIIGFYFGKSNPGSVYGGASAMVLILLWVYYSCLILFFGAEFTVQYAYYKQEKIEPTKYAEPAIYQRLESLEEKRKQLLDQDRILRILSKSDEHSTKK